MVVFVLALATLFLFWALGSVVDTQVREKLLGAICGLLGFGYEPKAQGFARDAFAILGLAGGNSVRLQDRIFGTADGIAFDLAWGVVADKTEELKPGTTGAHRARTIVRVDGLLMRFDDPAPPAVPFALSARVPEASPFALVAARTLAGQDGAVGDPPSTPSSPSRPATRLPPAVPSMRRRVPHCCASPACSTDAKPAAGFDGGVAVFAFATPKRFDIGPMHPPLADFARVEHLARQVCVVFEVAAALRTFRFTAG